MQEKAHSSHSVGFDLTDGLIRVAALMGDAKRPILEQIFEFSVEREDDHASNVKLLYTDEQKKLITHFVDNNLIVTALSQNQVLVRPLEIKLIKESDIDEALYFQSEPLLPYPLENAIVDRIIVTKTKDGSTLTIAAAKKEFISQQIELWKKLGIEPEVISSTPFALALFCGSNQKMLYCIHISEFEICCALIDNGKLIATKSSEIRLKDLFTAYIHDEPRGNKESYQQLDFSNLKSTQYPSLTEALDQLCLEATRLCYSHSKRLKGEEVQNIIVTGDVALLTGFEEYIAKKIDKSITLPVERNGLSVPLAELKKYAVPIGLALSALNNETNQINFRQHEFAYPDPWKRIKVPIISFLALCCFLAIVMYFMTIAYINYKESSLKMDYAELLHVINTDYNDLETEIATKNKTEKGTPIKNLSDLSLPEIQFRLNYIDTQVKNTPITISLLPNVPKVSDVLAWLSTNEIVLGTTNKEGEISPQIELEKFNYKLVKRPEKSKLNEKYQVKVDLEFTAVSPSIAREFHDFLMTPNPIIEPGSEIKWSTSKGKYSTSFFLKDKTIYQSGAK